MAAEDAKETVVRLQTDKTIYFKLESGRTMDFKSLTMKVTEREGQQAEIKLLYFCAYITD